MQSTSPGPLDGNGEEFFLDILFNRMSEIAIFRQRLRWLESSFAAA
jgi:hypothetical protein